MDPVVQDLLHRPYPSGSAPPLWSDPWFEPSKDIEDIKDKQSSKPRFSYAEKAKWKTPQEHSISPPKKWKVGLLQCRTNLQDPSASSSAQANQILESRGYQHTFQSRTEKENADINVGEADWELVRPAHWWRKLGAPGKQNQKHQKDQKLIPDAMKEERKQRFLKHVLGKCCNCFSTNHRAVDCTNATKCWKCLKDGHQASTCPSYKLGTPVLKQVASPRKQRETQSQTVQALPSGNLPPIHNQGPPLSFLQAVVRANPAMAAYPGDPRARPVREVCAISATGEIK